MKIFLRALLVLGALVAAIGIYLLGARSHWYGHHEGPGAPHSAPLSPQLIHERVQSNQRAASALTTAPTRQILFGDLHVHTTFSSDAFLGSLPMLGGVGAHPVSDACDFARFCSALDFWSINDHAEASTPRRWQETKDAIRQCNAVAGDPTNPDLVAFLGWEWSQVGATPAEHYGHKNVVLRDLDDDAVPSRAIGAGGLATNALRRATGRLPWYLPLVDFPNRQRYYDFLTFMDEIAATPNCPEGVSTKDLSADCYESAATPKELFEKLDESGAASIVIPHGNTWGFYTPAGATWDKQLAQGNQDPKRQFLIEVMSGHGNSEEYRDWQEVVFDAAGNASCPEPRPDYLPSCWRAGQIIRQRCLDAGLGNAECERREITARQHYLAAGVAGHNSVPAAKAEEWLDSGQCRDCFIPAFNLRPGGSTQYALAITNFDDPSEPKRFSFGMIASSDNHQAQAGTGFKEHGRVEGVTEARGPTTQVWRERLNPALRTEKPEPASRELKIADLLARGIGATEGERRASFLMTGGLAAVHSEGRSREEIWDALQRKEVYGTSGDHILLWFHLLNAGLEDGNIGSVPMGGEVTMHGTPRFEVRAVGAFRQKPGCPESSTDALSAERLAQLCGGECYNPSDERKLVTRIEIIRIRPQVTPGEPLRSLIEDPWKTIPCEPSQNGCVVQFEDPDFIAAARDTVYYVRAIEEPSPAVNAGGLRCKLDESGQCIEARPCFGDYRTPSDDDCLATIEERAWSSPIFVDAG